LADKVQGNLLGLWLLVPEHLRLGTWDLLCGWTGQPPERVEPRLALQLVHEAVLCTSGLRSDRSLTQGGGLELANGLPFLASDSAVHDLLAQHTVEDALRLQVALGKIRRASGHFRGRLLAVDPHRVLSYSQRHMRTHASHKASRPAKVAQTFWVLDADWHFKAFLCTANRAEVDALTLDFPRRWHVEEFFNAHQTLGWKRAGTANLHIRYGQMTMALLAQAAIHQLRMRLGEPVCGWDANHLAKDFFRGLDGDVRVQDDTILVTYYNAPNESQLREHYENLPHRLREENINPQVPWLYGFKLDFRFR